MQRYSRRDVKHQRARGRRSVSRGRIGTHRQLFLAIFWSSFLLSSIQECNSMIWLVNSAGIITRSVVSIMVIVDIHFKIRFAVEVRWCSHLTSYVTESLFSDPAKQDYEHPCIEAKRKIITLNQTIDKPLDVVSVVSLILITQEADLGMSFCLHS